MVGTGWELLFKSKFTGEPYGVQSSISSVFSFQKTIPVINIKHKDTDKAMVNHGLFPIAKLNLKENFEIKDYYQHKPREQLRRVRGREAKIQQKSNFASWFIDGPIYLL